MAADFGENNIRRIGEARRFGFQLWGRKKPGGDIQMHRQGMHRVFVGLEVEGNDAGDGARGQPRPRQRFIGEAY